MWSGWTHLFPAFQMTRPFSSQHLCKSAFQSTSSGIFWVPLFLSVSPRLQPAYPQAIKFNNILNYPKDWLFLSYVCHWTPWYPHSDIKPGFLKLNETDSAKVWYVMDRYQTRQMEQKDTRVNLVNEILNGIKVGNQFTSWSRLKHFLEQLFQGVENVRVGATFHGDDWRHQARSHFSARARRIPSGWIVSPQSFPNSPTWSNEPTTSSRLELHCNLLTSERLFRRVCECAWGYFQC